LLNKAWINHSIDRSIKYAVSTVASYELMKSPTLEHINSRNKTFRGEVVI